MKKGDNKLKTKDHLSIFIYFISKHAQKQVKYFSCLFFKHERFQLRSSQISFQSIYVLNFWVLDIYNCKNLKPKSNSI